MATLTDRLAAYTVDRADGCVVWTGHTSRYGYGQVRVGGGQRVYVHRLAYELAHGSIPDGYEVDHLCRTPSCVRVDHLEAVTHAENQARTTGIEHGTYNVGATCKHGHLRSENTRLDKAGARYCVPCATARSQRSKAARANRRG